MTEPIAWHRQLTVRVLLFLTLALVPLGIISIAQNTQLIDSAERRSELSLLALTQRASSGEQQVIERGFGTAQTLGLVIEAFIDDPAQCSAYLKRFLGQSTHLAYIGFIPPNGFMECSTADGPLDLSDYPAIADLMAVPKPSVDVSLSGPVSKQRVMVINQPWYDADGFTGYVSISIPLYDVGASPDFPDDGDPITLVTFNAKGALLSSEQGPDSAPQGIPRDIPLGELTQGYARTFVGKNADGIERVFAVIPIVPQVVYAISSWRPDSPAATSLDVSRSNVLLPLLMWIASLFVAWFAIDRLIVNKVGHLAKAMQQFARNRHLPSAPTTRGLSAELAILESTFIGMAEDLLHDEAAQEARLREKSILLKEVHHRVKNNLQIISSIMNMQIRKATVPETKLALSQVQDRIMGLSGIHHTLYQAQNLNQINAAALIRQIVEQTGAIGANGQNHIAIRTKLDTITIFPDQAVPLSMLVAEALTNAMKYLGRPAGGDPSVLVVLSAGENGAATLRVENTLEPDAPQKSDDLTQSTGLGEQLIRAFSTQLDGHLTISQTADHYVLTVDFTIKEFSEEPVDF